MSNKRHSEPLSEPPSKARCTASPGIGAMPVDLPPPAESMDPLTSIAKSAPHTLSDVGWQDDGTDTAFDSVLDRIYRLVIASPVFESSQNRVGMEQFIKNVAKGPTSDFVDLLRNALKEEDWSRVVTHDVFYIALPDDYNPPMSPETVMKSWEAPFVRTGSLKAFAAHIAKERGKEGSYAPYCSIVQSSGMGKSRLLDEFSKENFVIPVNLRRAKARGFPPPDNAVRDLLTKPTSDHNKSYTRSLHFLFALFLETLKVITVDLKEARNFSERVTQFREFMTDGQTVAGVGEKRRKFYKQIADEVELYEDAVMPATGVVIGLKRLLRRLDFGTQTGHKSNNLPGVFIAFDEAQALAAEPLDDTNRTHFTELRRALQVLDGTSSFSIFLSTTSSIFQIASRSCDGYMDKTLRLPPPFSDLGFDQMMQSCKIFDEYKTIDDVTSTECVVHMGRPLWSTIYDHGEPGSCDTIPSFAAQKLLCGPDDGSGRKSLTTDQECAVLSQRLALDIDGTTYVLKCRKGCDMAEKARLQIANHMRVCISIPEELATVHSVAPSEPIHSEAASLIMRGNYNFNLPDALLNVLDTYAIGHENRGELLVAAFFTRARDLLIQQISKDELFPHAPICRTFSVTDLLSNLFHEAPFGVMLDSMPSICRPDFSPQKFRDAFGRTRMHFNHLIKPYNQKVLARPYLVTMMARGAAAYGTNCQPGFDAVYPFLYETSDLDANKVGFVIVQVKNHVNDMTPNTELFRKMDPFVCQLLSEEDSPRFTIPIIRILFAPHEEKSFVEQQIYASPAEGAETLDADERPLFTSYDFWCSGIGPGILRPVDEGDAQEKWATLLDGSDDSWDYMLSAPEIPGIRRSQYPAGGADMAYFDAWMSPIPHSCE